MTPLIKYHSIISCYTSRCEIDEKIWIAQGIYFYSFSSHSEFFTHDFSTSIYLYQIYPDFWTTRTSLSSLMSILWPSLYAFYLFFEVIDRDLFFEDISRSKKKSFKHQEKNKSSSHKKSDKTAFSRLKRRMRHRILDIFRETVAVSFVCFYYSRDFFAEISDIDLDDFLVSPSIIYPPYLFEC